MIAGGKAARSGLAYGLEPVCLQRCVPAHQQPAFSSACTQRNGLLGRLRLLYWRHRRLPCRHRPRRQCPPAWRWLLGVGIAAISGVMFLARFPDLATGPWGGVNPALAKLILDNVSEAQPMVSFHRGVMRSAVTLIGPLLAFGSNLFFLRHAEPRDRWAWSVNAVLLLAALLLSSFYQVRFVGGLGLFMLLPLTVLLHRGWVWVGKNYQGRQKLLAEIGLLLLVGPLPGVLLPALVDGRSFNVGVLLFPAQSNGAAACDMYGLERVLRSPVLYRGKPRIIMNTMGLGPELLFRTPDMVTSAPYHEDVNGNLDAVRFFSTTNPAKAEAIARQRHIDLVVTCKLIPGMYMDLGGIKQALPDTEETVKKSPGDKPAMPFILRILSGKQLPPWFKPVQSPLLKNYVVYEITPPVPRERKSPAAN